MKKFLFVCVILFSSIIYSQNQKGEMLLSVAVSPYPTTTNDENDFGAIGLASFEFFVSNKLSLSGSFFTTNNTLISDNSGITIHSYGFIPSIHYYFVTKKSGTSSRKQDTDMASRIKLKDTFKTAHSPSTTSVLERITKWERSYTLNY